MSEQQTIKSKVVKPMSRGQITIPIEFRTRLGIDENTYIRLTLDKNKIILTPAFTESVTEEKLREYTEKEILQFIKEDKIDYNAASTVKKLLSEGKL